uniref:HMA domain-containing protein n=1 Tax=Opuntia streptacantha TaxID=393608 RepID=A0A7C8ZPT1_OPUST
MAKKKTVVKVPITSQRCQTDIMKAVAKLNGVEKIEVDASRGTLIIVGEVEPVPIFKRLTKIGKTPEIISVGPSPPPICGQWCTCSLCRPYVRTKCEPRCTCSLCRPYCKHIPPYPSQYFPRYSKQCEVVDVSYPVYSGDIGQCSIL